MNQNLEHYAPPFQKDDYTEEEKYLLEPFFTNLDKSVYVALIFSPELVGALLSRTSRASGDLRKIFLDEFIKPFIEPMRDGTDDEQQWQDKLKYAKGLKEFIDFLHTHPFLEIFANPRARSFYIKWLAQYGDDSIAQLSGLHLVYTGISQTTIKHFEDMRIGIAPIEKSTRYVNYSKKVNGRFLYYRDPDLSDLGLQEEYVKTMDNLFETYSSLIPRLTKWLKEKYPEEKPSVIEKKSFDTLRGLLPSSTISQVAFFGNGQAFEYLINRSLKHSSGEIRWAATRAKEELSQVAPSFFRRLDEPMAQDYQLYLASKKSRMKKCFTEIIRKSDQPRINTENVPKVTLIDYDQSGLEKVITAMIYDAPGNHLSWKEVEDQVNQLNHSEKDTIITDYFSGRSVKWMKVGRALENTFLRFEITINIGAWRDLHRHRMLTQQKQLFSCYHGYDTPIELIESGLSPAYQEALDEVKSVFMKLDQRDHFLAQQATCLAHRLRFMQYKNLRECFWEGELRTIPEGHPDYRHIEQLMFLELEKAFPLITKHMLVNKGHYDFARRGQDEAIAKKLPELSR